MMNIIGRVTGDAQVRTLPSDKQVVNFSVAVNDSYRNKQGARVNLTEYFDCAYWLTPNVAGALTKGTLVELTGRVSARAWLGSDGEAHAKLNFHTSQIKFHVGGKGTLAGTTVDTAKPSPKKGRNRTTTESDDLPF